MYDAWRAADMRPQVPGHSLLEDVGGGSRFQALRAWFRRRREASRIRRELLEMGGRELAELGLTVADIPHVHDGNFRRR